MRIGIFGGSFDPIHRGHLIVAAAAADQLRLDQVHFVVARAQPFKGGEHGASAQQRAEMVGLAIAGDSRFVLDVRELSRDAPSYSVETLRELRHERPQDELFLLIGADVAQEFPQWRDAREVARLATVIVLTRPGIRPPAQEFVGRILVVPAVDISATAVREKARHGESIRHLVPSHVGDYIETHGLYRPESRER